MYQPFCNLQKNVWISICTQTSRWTIAKWRLPDRISILNTKWPVTSLSSDRQRNFCVFFLRHKKWLTIFGDDRRWDTCCGFWKTINRIFCLEVYVLSIDGLPVRLVLFNLVRLRSTFITTNCIRHTHRKNRLNSQDCLFRPWSSSLFSHIFPPLPYLRHQRLVRLLSPVQLVNWQYRFLCDVFHFEQTLQCTVDVTHSIDVHRPNITFWAVDFQTKSKIDVFPAIFYFCFAIIINWFNCPNILKLFTFL